MIGYDFGVKVVVPNKKVGIAEQAAMTMVRERCEKDGLDYSKGKVVCSRFVEDVLDLTDVLNPKMYDFYEIRFKEVV